MCLCLLMGMGQVQGVRASEDAYIPNDETGIPDPDLYGVILDNGDLNGDGKLRSEFHLSTRGIFAWDNQRSAWYCVFNEFNRSLYR